MRLKEYMAQWGIVGNRDDQIPMKPSDIEKEFVERVEKSFSPEQEPQALGEAVLIPGPGRPMAVTSLQYELLTIQRLAFEAGRKDGVAKERERIKKLITEEIATAHKEGEKTSRLTSLYAILHWGEK